MTATKPQLIDCPRCTGQGNLSHFAHVSNGVCFLCGGRGRLELKRLLSQKGTLQMVVFKATPARVGIVPKQYDGAGRKRHLPSGQASVSVSCMGKHGTEWSRTWQLDEISAEQCDALRQLFRSFVASGRRVQVNFRNNFFWEQQPYARVWNPTDWDRTHGRYLLMGDGAAC